MAKRFETICPKFDFEVGFDLNRYNIIDKATKEINIAIQVERVKGLVKIKARFAKPGLCDIKDSSLR